MAVRGFRGSVPKATLVGQLHDLGVRAGDILIVHTSFSQVGPVEGGPEGLIEALLEALGPRGALVMPSMADTDDQPFNPATTPCRKMVTNATSPAVQCLVPPPRK